MNNISDFLYSVYIDNVPVFTFGLLCMTVGISGLVFIFLKACFEYQQQTLKKEKKNSKIIIPDNAIDQIIKLNNIPSISQLKNQNKSYLDKYSVDDNIVALELLRAQGPENIWTTSCKIKFIPNGKWKWISLTEKLADDIITDLFYVTSTVKDKLVKSCISPKFEAMVKHSESCTGSCRFLRINIDFISKGYTFDVENVSTALLNNNIRDAPTKEIKKAFLSLEIQYNTVNDPIIIVPSIDGIEDSNIACVKRIDTFITTAVINDL